MPNTNNKREINDYLKALVNSPKIDVSAFADNNFCDRLKMRCLEDASFMLIKIQHEQSYASRHQLKFDLVAAINQTHPETKLNLLDYCVAAGLDELAYQLIFLGAKSKVAESIKANLSNKYTEDLEQPDIVSEIDAILTKLGLLSSEVSSEPIEQTLTEKYWTKVKWMTQDYRVAAVMLLLGLALSLAAPFVPAVTASILLAINAPALVIAVNVYRTAKSAEDEKNKANNVDQVKYEELKIIDLINAVNRMKYNLKSDNVYNLNSQESTYERRQSHHVDTEREREREHETILYEFLKKHGANESGLNDVDIAALRDKLLR